MSTPGTNASVNGTMKVAPKKPAFSKDQPGVLWEGELNDGEAAIVGRQTVELERTERCLVVVNRLLRVTHRQPWRDIRIRCRTHSSN